MRYTRFIIILSAMLMMCATAFGGAKVNAFKQYACSRAIFYRV